MTAWTGTPIPEAAPATADLTSPARVLMPAIEAMTNIRDLAALGTAEAAGQHRATVLNAIQKQIGVLYVTQHVEPEHSAEPAAAMNIRDVPGNRDVGESAVVDGNVTTTRKPNVALWFRDGPGGIAMPRMIPAGAAQDCMASGATDACPDCLRKTCGIGPDGRLTGNPNDCPARDALPFGRCPICAKRFTDPGAAPSQMEAEEGEIILQFSSTPESRVQSQVRLHVLAFHGAEAARYGIYANQDEARVLAPPALPGDQPVVQATGDPSKG